MGFPKLLLSQDGDLLIERMVTKLRETGWQPIGCVVSDEGLIEFITRWLPGIDYIVNPNPERGMISSIRLGLEWAGDSAPGLLTWPVDHPLIEAETLGSIRSAASPERIVIPVHNGLNGHPTWWGISSWELLRSSTADLGARLVLGEPGVNIFELPVEDEGVLINLNTVEDAAKYNVERFHVDGQR